MEQEAATPIPDALGYLLKHAHLHFAELSGAALAPYGIDGRELAVITVLRGDDLLSQQEVALRLGVDRTTMVALVDELERKHLVLRRPHPEDRRKNVVALTTTGRQMLTKAALAVARAERRFLEPLSDAGARRFKDALRTLLT